MQNGVERTATRCGVLSSSPFRLLICRLTAPSCADVQPSPHRYRRHRHRGSGPRDGARLRCPRHAVPALRAHPPTRHGRRCGARRHTMRRRPPTGRESRTDAVDGHYWPTVLTSVAEHLMWGSSIRSVPLQSCLGHAAAVAEGAPQRQRFRLSTPRGRSTRLAHRCPATWGLWRISRRRGLPPFDPA